MTRGDDRVRGKQESFANHQVRDDLRLWIEDDAINPTYIFSVGGVHAGILFELHLELLERFENGRLGRPAIP